MRRASGSCRRAPTPASTIERATTGRTPTAGRRRRGSSWLEAGRRRTRRNALRRPRPANPFLADLEAKEPIANPFATERPVNPFLTPGDEDDAGPVDNPFAPRPVARPAVGSDAPRKLQLLAAGWGSRGLRQGAACATSPAAYAQFGPLTAYPRAQRTRELYPALPDAPASRGHHLHRDDGRGARRRPRPGPGGGRLRRPRRARVHRRRGIPDDRRRTGCDERGDARLLASVGFALAIDDERFPVMRRDLA